MVTLTWLPTTPTSLADCKITNIRPRQLLLPSRECRRFLRLVVFVETLAKGLYLVNLPLHEDGIPSMPSSYYIVPPGPWLHGTLFAVTSLTVYDVLQHPSPLASAISTRLPRPSG